MSKRTAGLAATALLLLTTSFAFAKDEIVVREPGKGALNGPNHCVIVPHGPKQTRCTTGLRICGAESADGQRKRTCA